VCGEAAHASYLTWRRQRRLDEKELDQLEQRLSAQRAKTTDDDQAAAIERQLAAVEQRVRQLKRNAHGYRWWRW
jgi:hypothetical protein